MGTSEPVSRVESITAREFAMSSSDFLDMLGLKVHSVPCSDNHCAACCNSVHHVATHAQSPAADPSPTPKARLSGGADRRAATAAS